MARRMFILAALILLLGGWFDVAGEATAAEMLTCPEPLECALQWEFCGQTAVELCGDYAGCCTGFCLSPDTTHVCDGDQSQCRCYDVGLTQS